MKKLIFILLCTSLAIGCRTKKDVEIQTIETVVVQTDTFIKTDTLIERDSIYVVDSVNVRYIVGNVDTITNIRVDTIYKEKIRYEYRDKAKTQTSAEKGIQNKDSVRVEYKYKEKVVEVEKKLSTWQTFCIWFTWLCILAIVAYVAYRIYKWKNK